MRRPHCSAVGGAFELHCFAAGEAFGLRCSMVGCALGLHCPAVGGAFELHGSTVDCALGLHCSIRDFSEGYREPLREGIGGVSSQISCAKTCMGRGYPLHALTPNIILREIAHSKRGLRPKSFLEFYRRGPVVPRYPRVFERRSVGSDGRLVGRVGQSVGSDGRAGGRVVGRSVGSVGCSEGIRGCR